MADVEKFKTSVNDVTGDLIKSKASSQKAYADNWERIFQKPKDSTPKAEQALSRLVDEGVLTDNVIRRHEEQNIGKGFTFTAQAAYPLSVAVFEEESLAQLAPPFMEEVLPSGLIEDNI